MQKLLADDQNISFRANCTWRGGPAVVSFLKSNRLTERLALQLRVEFFNLLNGLNFGPPGTYADGANFGVVIPPMALGVVCALSAQSKKAIASVN